VRDRLLLAACCLTATLIAAGVAWGPLEAMPHVSDELSYTLQARLFAAGMRTGPPGDVPSALQLPFWLTEPRSFSPFPIGWPLLLSVAERAGAAWLLNPLLAGLLPLLAWSLGREWSGPAEARLAALVAAVSPGVWMLGASRMAHTSVLVALGVAAVVVQRRRDPPWAWGLAALCVAYVVLARPYDAVLVGLPLLVLGVLRAPGWGARGALVLLPGAAAAVVLWDNLRLTGSPWDFPMELFFAAWAADRPGCDQLGFGPDRRCFGPPGWSPADAAEAALAHLRRLDLGLLGTPGGSLFALVGLWRLRRPAALALIGAVVLGYALYWSPGAAYGARFYHPLYLVLPLAVAVGAQRLLGRFAPLVLLGLPLAASPPLLTALSDRYWCVDGRLRDTLAAAGITEGVVFLRATGARTASWPALEAPPLRCDPQLESIDGFALLDPTRTQGGLQVRHALPDEELGPYLRRFQPGAPAWIALHDVETDERTLLRLDPGP
jgi:hypothetical protein